MCIYVGVSNFTIAHLADLLSDPSNEVPVVNQVELHPLCAQRALREYCASKGILVQAYSSLGQGSDGLLEHSVIVQIAAKHKISPADVLLLWAVQQGIPVIPKTKTSCRLESNLLRHCEEIELDAADMELIDSLDVDHHYCWNPAKVL